MNLIARSFTASHLADLVNSNYVDLRTLRICLLLSRLQRFHSPFKVSGSTGVDSSFKKWFGSSKWDTQLSKCYLSLITLCTFGTLYNQFPHILHLIGQLLYFEVVHK